VDENSLHAALTGLNLPAIHYFNVIGSTNDFARTLLEQGAPDGTLVVADEQTQGRGRLDRRWVTPPGSALAFSLVLHPTALEQAAIGLFAPLFGVAVCQSLQEQYGLAAVVKWPNDVLLQRRKTCGVLVEAHWLGIDLQGLVAGIGINVARASVPPAAEVRFPATCVEDQLGKRVPREELLAAVLRAFYEERSILTSPAFLVDWEERLAFKEEWVRVECTTSVQAGRVKGITVDGGLRLQPETGPELVVSVGDVRLRPAR
jgi:BirA family transcriptional regulator, biotin operon repressor / biotin---[acetyl-CoA-carboxylase] ligase